MAAIRPDFPRRCWMGWTHTSLRHGPWFLGGRAAPGPGEPLTDGSGAGQVPGLTAMLPELLLDWLTIKISKEITAAHWQLLQLFAPAPLVFCTCLAWIRADSCWPHFTFPQAIYSRIILPDSLAGRTRPVAALPLGGGWEGRREGRQGNGTIIILTVISSIAIRLSSLLLLFNCFSNVFSCIHIQTKMLDPHYHLLIGFFWGHDVTFADSSGSYHTTPKQVCLFQMKTQWYGCSLRPWNTWYVIETWTWCAASIGRSLFCLLFTHPVHLQCNTCVWVVCEIHTVYLISRGVFPIAFQHACRRSW